MRDHADALAARSVSVTLVSFGSPAAARTWRSETASPFPMLLDPERRAYAAFGLRRSVWRSWHPHMFAVYARLLWRGRRLRRVQGDPNQLGGDFLVDRDGTIRFAQPSDDPSDRPTVGDLLAALDTR